MRVLLDESIPRKLARELAGHEEHTIPQLGWAGTKNGELLKRAVVDGFHALVTADQNLEHQQNISKAGLGVVVLVARSNRIVHLKPLVPQLLSTLKTIVAGSVVRVVA